MKRKEIYDTIVKLTSELVKTGFPKELFDTSKKGDAEKVQDVFLEFGKHHKKLFTKINDLGEKINELSENSTVWSLKIFGDESDIKKDNSIMIYDPKVIDPVGFCALTILGWIDEAELFASWPAGCDPYYEGLETAGYEELSNALDFYSWGEVITEGDYDLYPSISDYLVAVFKGEI